MIKSRCPAHDFRRRRLDDSGARRRCVQLEEILQLDARTRIGRDNKWRPVHSASVRSRVAEALREHPGASLRTVAKSVGVSPETVRIVRMNMDATCAADVPGEPPTMRSAARRTGKAGVVGPGSSSGFVGPRRGLRRVVRPDDSDGRRVLALRRLGPAESHLRDRRRSASAVRGLGAVREVLGRPLEQTAVGRSPNEASVRRSGEPWMAAARFVGRR